MLVTHVTHPNVFTGAGNHPPSCKSNNPNNGSRPPRLLHFFKAGGTLREKLNLFRTGLLAAVLITIWLEMLETAVETPCPANPEFPAAKILFLLLIQFALLIYVIRLVVRDIRRPPTRRISEALEPPAPGCNNENHPEHLRHSPL